MCSALLTEPPQCPLYTTSPPPSRRTSSWLFCPPAATKPCATVMLVGCRKGWCVQARAGREAWGEGPLTGSQPWQRHDRHHRQRAWGPWPDTRTSAALSSTAQHHQPKPTRSGAALQHAHLKSQLLRYVGGAAGKVMPQCPAACSTQRNHFSRKFATEWHDRTSQPSMLLSAAGSGCPGQCGRRQRAAEQWHRLRSKYGAPARPAAGWQRRLLPSTMAHHTKRSISLSGRCAISSSMQRSMTRAADLWR